MCVGGLGGLTTQTARDKGQSPSRGWWFCQLILTPFYQFLHILPYSNWMGKNRFFIHSEFRYIHNSNLSMFSFILYYYFHFIFVLFYFVLAKSMCVGRGGGCSPKAPPSSSMGPASFNRSDPSVKQFVFSPCNSLLLTSWQNQDFYLGGGGGGRKRCASERTSTSAKPEVLFRQ